MAAECGSKSHQRRVQRAVGLDRDRAAVDAREVCVGAAEQVERMEAAGGRALPFRRIEQVDGRCAAAVDDRLPRGARCVEAECRGGRREVVVRDGQEDQVGGVGDLLRRIDRLAAVDARSERRGRFGRAARDRDDGKAGLRKALRDAARETAGADEAEAGWVGERHGSGRMRKRSSRQYRRNEGVVAGGRFPRRCRYGLPVRGAIRTRRGVRQPGRITIEESDPETYRARIPLELSASCLKFVIVHYARVPARCAGSGKTDRSPCRDPTRRTESRGRQGSRPAGEAAPYGGCGRVQLQFATNARYARGGFSLHWSHATCMPAVADRSA